MLKLDHVVGTERHVWVGQKDSISENALVLFRADANLEKMTKFNKKYLFLMPEWGPLIGINKVSH